MVGSSHARLGRGCDDAHGWLISDSVAAFVVADGAGSRPLSAIGSHVAVAAVLAKAATAEFTSEHSDDPEGAMRALVSGSIVALGDEADRMGAELRDLATTLCCAVITPGAAAVAQVGDGIAVVELADGTVQSTGIPEPSEYANETVFLTASDALESLKIFAAPGGDALRSLALSTDGLRYKLLEDPGSWAPYLPFFEESWAYARAEDPQSAAIASFLEGVDDQTGDDKTLLLAVREFQGAAGLGGQITERPVPAL